jgi:outer membrane receptor protein involved in Fe transport
MSQLPFLYVVDGIRLQRDQVPLLSSEQISSVEVVKGRAALKQYGADASYGVVVITTKAALVPHS